MLKDPDRFPHVGVRDALQGLRRRLSTTGRYQFGSSGEGELTIKGAEQTAYARKYKIRDGWRVARCRGKDCLEVVHPKSAKEVFAFITGRIH